MAKFTPDIVIQDRVQDRIKMRLILATFSKEGLKLFRDVQEKVEKEEMAVRHKTKRNASRQNTLFGDEILAQMQQDAYGVGCKTNKEKAKIVISKVLEKHGSIKFQKLSNFLIERYPLRETHVKDILKSMKDIGLITYELPSRKKKAQPHTIISLKD